MITLITIDQTAHVSTWTPCFTSTAPMAVQFALLSPACRPLASEETVLSEAEGTWARGAIFGYVRHIACALPPAILGKIRSGWSPRS